MSDDIRQQILDLLNKKKDVKKKFYPKDICESLPGVDRRECKKVIQQMLDANELKYWSSGSTTYVMLPEFYDALVKE